jgi:hypothetical protein
MSKYTDRMFELREKRLNRRSTCPILRNKRAFRIAVEMLEGGRTYREVAERLNSIPGFRTSITSMERFWHLYMKATHE